MMTKNSFIVLGVMFVLVSLITFLTIDVIKHLIKLRKENKQLKEENAKVKENLAKASGLPMKTNFKSDVEFLEYIIGFKVENIKIYRLKPLQLAQTAIIGDKDFSTWTEEVVLDVCTTLSTPYKRMLSAYFTEESLIEYITEQVTAKLTSEILSANFIIRR